MAAKIKYTDERPGRLKVVENFPPAPEDLVFRDEGVRVTIALSKRSVDQSLNMNVPQTGCRLAMCTALSKTLFNVDAHLMRLIHELCYQY